MLCKTLAFISSRAYLNYKLTTTPDNETKQQRSVDVAVAAMAMGTAQPTIKGKKENAKRKN